ncbi:MAG: hypothetical protein AAB410_01475 [Patescibacteria group bacterium]
MLNKIKYQNPNFRRKLNEARGYRRPIKKIPETKAEFFLAYFHLDGMFAKYSLLILLLALIYLIYAPNFLTVKTIQINGVSSEANASMQKTAGDYLSLRGFVPKSNLLFTSKRGLAEYLSAKNIFVEKVESIEKNFPSALVIQAKERYNKFLLYSLNGIYLLSNDGIVRKQINSYDINASTSTYSGLLTIKLSQNKSLYENQKAADSDYFENLNEILYKSEHFLQNSATEIQIETLEHPDLQIITRFGFTIKFDINSDLNKVFEQLKLLQKEIGEARINGIKYIDMRVKDKGYVCYKDALCSQETTAPKATSTPK